MKRLSETESDEEWAMIGQVLNSVRQDRHQWQSDLAAHRQFGLDDLSLITGAGAIVGRRMRRHRTILRWTLCVLVALRLATRLVYGNLCVCGIHKAGTSALKVQNQTKSEQQNNAFHSASARIAQLRREPDWISKTSRIPHMNRRFPGMNGTAPARV